MWTRAELKSQAKLWLKSKFWYVLAVTLMPTLALKLISMVLFNIAPLAIVLVVPITIVLIFLVETVVEVGVAGYFIRSMQGKQDMGFGGLFVHFKDGNHMNVVKVQFLRNLFIALWSFLFAIPGYIKHYQYRMVPYLLAEYPDRDYRDILGMSRDMMRGHKLKAFVLDLSFIGWRILGFCLCCTGHLLVEPYYQATYAQLYLTLKGEGGPIPESSAGTSTGGTSATMDQAKAFAGNLKNVLGKKKEEMSAKGAPVKGMPVTEDSVTRPMTQPKTGFLIGIQGNFTGAEIPIEYGGELVVGRDPSRCSLVVDQPYVSRVHVKIGFDGKAFQATDCSEVGTFDLQKGRLPKDKTVSLPSGTHLQIGTTGDIFKLECR